MRTRTMNSVNGPVSPNWAESQCSKSVFILELDDRSRRHVALEHLQEGLTAIGFVPGLESAERRNRVGDRRFGRFAVAAATLRSRMCRGMQRLGDRPQPVEQRT